MRTIWFYWLITIYLLACFLPEVKGVTPPGYAYLLKLPWAMFFPAWWANPLFFAGCVALAKEKTAIACVLGVLATMLASTFFIMTFSQKGLTVFKVPCFDCWLLSMISLAASGFLPKDKTDETEKADRLNEV